MFSGTFFVVAAVLNLSAALAVLINNNAPNMQSPDPAPPICTTPGCVLTAARLLNSMDVTADPCDDFYQYSCGKYIASHIIPDDENEVTIFQELQQIIDVDLKSVLEDDKFMLSSSGSVTIEKTKNVFKACMNTTNINNRGVKPGLDFLRSTNAWPVVFDNAGDKKSADFDLVQSIANVARLGQSALISVSVQIDSKNATKYSLLIDQPDLGMPSRDYLLRGINDSNVKAYYQYITSVANILKNAHTTDDDASDDQWSFLFSSIQRARDQSELLDVVEFEIKLANITTPQQLRRDPLRLYNNMTVAELRKKLPKFDWLRLVNAYLADSGVVVDELEVVVVAEPEYLAKLLELIESTPARTLANYLGWRTIDEYVMDLGSDSLQAARLQYTSAVFGIAQDEARWKTCIKEASNTVVMGVARLYVEKFFDSDSKALAETLISNIQEAFQQELATLEWLGENERKLSIEKMTAMLRLIGYDARILNDTWLDNEYSLYQGNLEAHFENIVGNARANDALFQMRLRSVVDRSRWDRQTADINAEYNPSVNTIMFLAGILQPPFFGREQPMVTNFGAIGIVMGHEITHGFDDQGRHFDKDGSLRDWWGNETIEKFTHEAQCVVDYYSNFTVAPIGLHINGNVTLGENLADLGGTRFGYRAYNNWKAKNPTLEVRLPGLVNVTSDQLFFLSGAQVWCASLRPERLRQRVLTDVHSPPKYRVLGEFSNFPGFATAFNCPVGRKMNPASKCKVW